MICAVSYSLLPGVDVAVGVYPHHRRRHPLQLRCGHLRQCARHDSRVCASAEAPECDKCDLFPFHSNHHRVARSCIPHPSHSVPPTHVLRRIRTSPPHLCCLCTSWCRAYRQGQGKGQGCTHGRCLCRWRKANPQSALSFTQNPWCQKCRYWFAVLCGV